MGEVSVNIEQDLIQVIDVTHLEIILNLKNVFLVFGTLEFLRIFWNYPEFPVFLVEIPINS